MQFLYPSFLWALLALAIPIIIHLFYFRRFKKVDFTNVKFLKEIKEETSHRSKIRNLLVLMCRMLALGALILAFAYPFFKNDANTIAGRKATSIFLDNSFSMASKSEDVILLEKAKESARQIVEGHNEDDVFQVITHDLEGRHQRWQSKEDILGSIDDVILSPASQSLSTVWGRQQRMFAKNPDHNHHAFWLSDFQKDMMDMTSVGDSMVKISMLPLQSVEENNVSIDSVWLSGPIARQSENNKVHIQLTNHGAGAVENVRLSMEYGGQKMPLKVINLNARETTTDTFNISVRGEGWQSAQFKITDHPITFDDHFFLSFEVPGSLNILVVHDQPINPSLSKALNSFKGVNWEADKMDRVDYSSLNNYDLIVLDEVRSISSGLTTELKKAQSNGGNIFFIPSGNGDLKSYSDLLAELQGPSIKAFKKGQREVHGINIDEFIFNDVFFKLSKNIRLPKVEGSFQLERSGRGFSESLLSYRDGGTFLGKYTRDDGRLFVLGSPLNTKMNNLAQNAEVFIPMLYKMALSRSANTVGSYTIGQDEIIEIPDPSLSTEEVIEMKGPSEFIPGIQRLGKKIVLRTEGQIKDEGVYDVLVKDQLLRKVAFNYDRKESRMSFLKVDDKFASDLSPKTEVIKSGSAVELASFLKEEREGMSIWRTLLIICLIFLGLEQVLLRFWKT